MQPIERPQSLAESVLKRLRAEIVSGDFALGQPLSERALAESLGVSKTPVREALAQLRLEGLVHIRPQRGAFVFTLSQREVVEMCELRQALESSACRLSIERNQRRFYSDLEGVVVRMRAAFKDGDQKAYLAEDTNYHLCFFRSCGNTLMEQNYGMFVGKIAALRTHLAQKPQHIELSFHEHESMLDAVGAGNVAEALSTLDIHIARTKETYSAGVTDIAAADKSPARQAV